MPGPNSLQDIRWYTQWTLNKGLFANMQAVDIPPDGCAICDNFVYRDGFLRSRPGTLSILTPKPNSNVAAHVGSFARTNGAALDVLGTISGSVPYTLELWVGYPWPGVATFSLANAVPFTRQLTSCTFKDEYYIAPGEEDILVIKTDGTVETLAGRQSNNQLKHPGKPRYITCNDGRIWLANTYDTYAGGGGSRVPYRVHCSDFLLSQTWNGGIDGGSSRYWDLAGETDAITGIWASGSYVMVFKRRAIYTGEFVGPPGIYNFTRTSRGLGCVSHQTIREWRKGILLWLGDDADVYMGAVGQVPQSVGGAIKERIRAVATVGGLGNLRMARAAIDLVKDYYHIFLSGSDTNRYDKVFTLDLNSGAWWEGTLPTGMNITAASQTIQGDYDNVNTSDFAFSNIHLGTSDGRVLQYDWSYATDDGVAMTCTYRTGVWNYAKIANRETMEVQPQAIRVLGTDTGSVITLNCNPYQVYNRAAGSGFSGTQTMSASASMYVEGRCQGESFDINIIAPATARIAGIGVGYHPMGDIHRRR